MPTGRDASLFMRINYPLDAPAARFLAHDDAHTEAFLRYTKQLGGGQGLRFIEREVFLEEFPSAKVAPNRHFYFGGFCMARSEYVIDRRTFLRRSLAAATALPILSVIASETGSNLAHADPTQPLDPSFPQAVSFGYAHDATTVDTTKFPKRAGAEGAKQFCHSCQLLQKGGMKVEGKEGTWGVCTLFPQGLVNENGWCNMWVPKPAA